MQKQEFIIQRISNTLWGGSVDSLRSGRKPQELFWGLHCGTAVKLLSMTPASHMGVRLSPSCSTVSFLLMHLGKHSKTAQA